MDTQNIVANSGNISLEKAGNTQGEFCKAWPSVKSGLQLLQGIIKNPIAKAAIGIVIAAGDAVSKEVCG